MTRDEFEFKWGPKTAFKTVGRHGEFNNDLDAVLAAERDRLTYICTNAKVRDDATSGWKQGWNWACRALCNAIGNNREVPEDEKEK